MAFYLVRARARPELIGELQSRLYAGEFTRLRPFGPTLTRSLEEARVDPKTGEAIWEEEDYCSPPLAQERAAVLDRYFEDVRVEPVRQGQGWASIAHLPRLWAETRRSSGADASLSTGGHKGRGEQTAQ